jgi:uncharacterized protein (DUF488 family)
VVTVYTVGHSNRSLGELIALLHRAGIEILVDVRARPHSRRHPQFAGGALRGALEQAGITYHWAGRQLGGMRPARPDSPHVALPEGGFRGYADHMDTEVFQRGAAQLVQLAGRAPTSVMCAERAPAECHRSLIADYLSLQGARVVHLIAPGESREHVLSPLARRESSRLVYDRTATGRLDL